MARASGTAMEPETMRHDGAAGGRELLERVRLLHELAGLQQSLGRLDEAARAYREAEALLESGGPSPTIAAAAERDTDSVAYMLGPRGETLIRLLNRILDHELELQPLLELVTGIVIETTGAERGFFMLTGPDDAPSEGDDFLYARNMDESEVSSPEFAVSRGIVRRAAAEGRSVVVDDAQADERFAGQASVQALELRSVLCVPVVHQGESLGALYLEDRRRASRFDPQDRALVEHLADRIAGLLRGSLRQRRRVRELSERNEAFRRSLRQLTRKYAFHNIIGASEAMQGVYELLDRVAATDAAVLIQGESGTGKELVARAIHFNSLRRDEPFQVIHCLGLAEGVLEAELFGYEPGAFTGAERARKGLFEAAHGGTLLLDEVAGMSPTLQGALLRVLQEGEVRPLGSTTTRKVDVRLLAASNRELEELVAAGEFREDLYWRLNVVRLKLPPLRARRSDIPLLARHFVKTLCRDQGREAVDISEEALVLLQTHGWPGNVRELRNVIQRALVLRPGEAVAAETIAFEDAGAQQAASLEEICSRPYQEAKRSFGEHYLRLLLARNRGNVSACARESGMQRQAFQRLMRMHDVQRPGRGQGA